MEEYNDNTEAQEIEINLEADQEVETEEETVTISKKELSKLKRKAIAYDSTEKKPKNINNNPEVKTYNILEDEVADLILSGYTKEEVKFALANGGKAALDDPNSFVSIAINAKREQKRIENAVSETTSSGYASPGGKSYTEEQLRNMSVEELEQVLPKAS